MKKVIILVSALLISTHLYGADKKTTNTVNKAGKNLERQTIGGLKNTNRSFARSYGMAGCGLGSMVMGNKEGQILAATTNGTSFNQMFGITFGTLNCVGSPLHSTADRIDPFIAANKIAFADDVARAEGETLAAVSHLMGCSEHAELGPVLKSNFSEIFSSPDLAPNEITDRVLTVVGRNDVLSRECGVQI